jgi:hypothetical protein
MAKTRTSGQGRPKGALNKVTRTVREAFERAFLMLQRNDVASLETWASENPTEFYKLAARLIPAEMNIGVNAGKIAERLLDARRVTGKVAPAVTQETDDEDLA